MIGLTDKVTIIKEFNTPKRYGLLVKSTQIQLRASGHYLKEVSLEFITPLAKSIYRIILTSMSLGITTEKTISLCF
ncbi:MAG: hypothetical protein ABH934_03940 [Chloroflexota bacterium]